MTILLGFKILSIFITILYGTGIISTAFNPRLNVSVSQIILFSLGLTLFISLQYLIY